MDPRRDDVSPISNNTPMALMDAVCQYLKDLSVPGKRAEVTSGETSESSATRSSGEAARGELIERWLKHRSGSPSECKRYADDLLALFGIFRAWNRLHAVAKNIDQFFKLSDGWHGRESLRIDSHKDGKKRPFGDSRPLDVAYALARIAKARLSPDQTTAYSVIATFERSARNSSPETSFAEIVGSKTAAAFEQFKSSTEIRIEDYVEKSRKWMNSAPADELVQHLRKVFRPEGWSAPLGTLDASIRVRLIRQYPALAAPFVGAEAFTLAARALSEIDTAVDNTRSVLLGSLFKALKGLGDLADRLLPILCGNGIPHRKEMRLVLCNLSNLGRLARIGLDAADHLDRERGAYGESNQPLRELTSHEAEEDHLLEEDPSPGEIPAYDALKKIVANVRCRWASRAESIDDVTHGLEQRQEDFVHKIRANAERPNSDWLQHTVEGIATQLLSTLDRLDELLATTATGASPGRAVISGAEKKDAKETRAEVLGFLRTYSDIVPYEITIGSAAADHFERVRVVGHVDCGYGRNKINRVRKSGYMRSKNGEMLRLPEVDVP